MAVPFSGSVVVRKDPFEALVSVATVMVPLMEAAASSISVTGVPPGGAVPAITLMDTVAAREVS